MSKTETTPVPRPAATSNVRSMTGFGRAETQMPAEGSAPASTLAVEFKSVNGKVAELSIRLPRRYGALEQVLRAEFLPRLVRGTATLSIHLEEGAAPARLNAELARAYHRELSALANELGAGQDFDVMGAVLRMPDIMRTTHEATPEELTAVQSACAQAYEAFDAFRMDEGAATAQSLSDTLGRVTGLVAQIDALEPERIAAQRTRLDKALESLAQGLNAKGGAINPDRMEQELLFYLERQDVAEERQRLGQHLAYFAETMANEPDPGRKLNFIGQEMGREINTIGSKANHALVQRHVVELKGELEKIKEQMANLI